MRCVKMSKGGETAIVDKPGLTYDAYIASGWAEDGDAQNMVEASSSHPAAQPDDSAEATPLEPTPEPVTPPEENKEAAPAAEKTELKPAPVATQKKKD